MSITIQHVIDSIIATIPDAPLEDTVDTVKTGDPDQLVTGIATTFLATSAVIQKAVDFGANLIITHEPTFYEHLDGTEWLQDDPIYTAKRRLIDDHNIVIWRFHDYWHRHRPDGILTGVLQELGWKNEATEIPAENASPIRSMEDYFALAKPSLCFDLPPQPLRELALDLKRKLDIHQLRVVGNPDMICTRAGLLVGKIGGYFQIKLLQESDVDLLICGEINEWETCEYVRDALYHQHPQALIILGHANSEEPGMKYCAEWLQVMFPELRIAHIPAGDPFRYI
jgi:putative NIF3 family GTP cyclohydrolase 1 type 2